MKTLEEIAEDYLRQPFPEDFNDYKADLIKTLREVERQTVERCIQIVNEGIDHHWTCHYEGKICTCGKDPTIAALKKEKS